MSIRTKKQDKLKRLLQVWPLHTITTTKWLLSQGFSYENIKRYCKSGWIDRVGTGAFQRTSDSVFWPGAIFGLQNQYQNCFHVGGGTALELQGHGHFIPLGFPTVCLFSARKKLLPGWFMNYIQTLNVRSLYLQYQFLPPHLALTAHNYGDFSIAISTRERAALEVVELLGRIHSFEDCRLLLESLGTLRTEVVQNLLENCSSIKAKRVFLFLSKNLAHRWFQELDMSKIDLGRGPRELVPGGTYDPEFQITCPKGFFDHDKLPV